MLCSCDDTHSNHYIGFYILSISVFLVLRLFIPSVKLVPPPPPIFFFPKVLPFGLASRGSSSNFFVRNKSTDAFAAMQEDEDDLIEFGRVSSTVCFMCVKERDRDKSVCVFI